MQSAYEDPKFSNFWNTISGKYGQTYKRYVLDPCLFKLMGALKNKVVLDLGCGNGYLGPKFLNKGAKRVILMDISEPNLNFARELNKKNLDRVDFIQQDATKTWKLKTGSVDLVFTDMMLNEVKNIKTPIEEAYRVLRRGGLLVAAVTHPAWDLYEYAVEKAGKPTGVLKGAGPYFFRGYSKFIMGTASLKPRVGEEYPESFEIEHFQRPIQDYFDAILNSGLRIIRFVEPEISKKVLREFPGYKQMTTHPIGLAFLALK